MSSKGTPKELLYWLLNLGDALKAAGVEVERKNIKILGGGIKTLGTYEAELKLHREVTAKFSFEVVAE